MDCLACNVIVCNVCSKQFSSDLNYSIHCRGHSSNASASLNSQIDNNLSCDISGENAFKSDFAEICDKNNQGVLSQPSELQTNLLDSQSKSNAFIHVKPIPSDEKPPSKKLSKGYLCAVCHGYFPLASTFKKHFMKHHMVAELPAGDRSGVVDSFKKTDIVENCKKSDTVHNLEKSEIVDNHKKLDIVDNCKKLIIVDSKKSDTVDNCKSIDIVDNSKLEQSDVTSSPVHDESICQPSKESSYNCKICGGEFASKIGLANHSRSHAKKEKCNTGGKVLFRKSNLVKRQSIHRVKKSFSCEICGKEFTSEILLAVHKQAHLKNKLYSCKICLQAFSAKIVLLEHYGQHNLKKIRCEFCGEGFANKHTFEKHFVIHLEDGNVSIEKDHFCEKCGKTFPSNDMLKIHQMIHIETVDMFPCKECERVFSSLSNLTMHEVKSHQRIEGEHYLCDQCGKKFMSKSSYRNHYVLHVNPDKLISCAICGQKFKTKFSMYHHRKKVHGPNEFSCSECSKVFRLKTKLKKHMQIHVESQPYMCNICDKRFRSFRSLNEHRTVHTDKKPHVCKICSREFRDKRNWKSHVRIHTGEKPFICDVCGRCFAVRRALKIHLRTHKSNMCGESNVLMDVAQNVSLKSCEDIDEDNLS